MIIVILIMIAVWFLPLPVALQVLFTVFGGLHCLVSIIRIINAVRNHNSSVDNSIVNQFLKR